MRSSRAEAHRTVLPRRQRRADDAFVPGVRAIRLDVQIPDRRVSPTARDDVRRNRRVAERIRIHRSTAGSAGGRRRTATKIHEEDHGNGFLRIDRRVQHHVDSRSIGLLTDRPHNLLHHCRTRARVCVGFHDLPSDARRACRYAAVDLGLVESNDLGTTLLRPDGGVLDGRAAGEDEWIGQCVRTHLALVVVRHVARLQRESQRIAIGISAGIRAAAGSLGRHGLNGGRRLLLCSDDQIRADERWAQVDDSRRHHLILSRVPRVYLTCRRPSSARVQTRGRASRSSQTGADTRLRQGVRRAAFLAA
jgi:hypothetical protein